MLYIETRSSQYFAPLIINFINGLANWSTDSESKLHYDSTCTLVTRCVAPQHRDSNATTEYCDVTSPHNVYKSTIDVDIHTDVKPNIPYT